MSASEAPSGTGPRTVVVNGTGTNQLSFQLPPGVTLDVESVYAAIDATAAGATTATLTIQEQSGVVIASKAQSQTVTAGAVGSATWALRLTDDGGGAAATTGLAIYREVAPVSTPANGAAAAMTFSQQSGPALLNLTNPALPTFVAAGIYALSLFVQRSDLISNDGGQMALDVRMDQPGVFTRVVGLCVQNTVKVGGGGAVAVPSVSLSATREFNAGARLQLLISQGSNAIRSFTQFSSIERLG